MQVSSRTTALMSGHAVRAAALAVGLTVLLASSGLGQDQPRAARKRIGLDGPRFGITYLSDGVVTKLAKDKITVSSVVSQFGWQFERQLFDYKGGVRAVTEWVVLVGGLDQGLVLPSVSWLVGARTDGDAEFALGPNVTPAGVALAIAVGYTFHAGGLNVPVNIAVVPSASGARVSLLTGFNMFR